MSKDVRIQDKRDEFRIMVLGGYASGKTSVINVLLDDNIFRVSQPCIRVLQKEIRYKDEKKVILYPIKGKYEGSDKLFEIPPEKLMDFLWGYYQDEDMMETSIEKIEIYWPLESLKNGLVLVETSGDTDIIPTLQIPLRHSDMILYCICAARDFSYYDITMIETLKTAGFFENSYCLITMMDMVELEATSDELKQFYAYCEQKCYDIGFKHPPFYIRNRLAMEALRENSDIKYAQSGFGELMNEIDLQMEAKQKRLNCERLI